MCSWFVQVCFAALQLYLHVDHVLWCTCICLYMYICICLYMYISDLVYKNTPNRNVVQFQVKTVEIIGRRSLLLVGFGGMFVFYAVMTISFRYEVGGQWCWKDFCLHVSYRSMQCRDFFFYLLDQMLSISHCMSSLLLEWFCIWQLQNLSGMNNVSVVATLLVVAFFQVGPGRKMRKIFGNITLIHCFVSMHSEDSHGTISKWELFYVFENTVVY